MPRGTEWSVKVNVMDGNGGDAPGRRSLNPPAAPLGSQSSMSPSYSLALGGRVPVCVSPASSDGSRRLQLQPPGVQDSQQSSSRAPHRPPVWSAHRPRVRDHQTGISDNDNIEPRGSTRIAAPVSAAISGPHSAHRPRRLPASFSSLFNHVNCILLHTRTPNQTFPLPDLSVFLQNLRGTFHFWFRRATKK